MTLSTNEQAIINILREAKPHSKILLQKKAKNDKVEYRVEVQESILLNKCKKVIDGLE